MNEQSQNNNSIESVESEKTQLEKKKIELEIKQLEQSYFKKSILPTLLQVLITSIVAVASILFAYKNILTDAKEKNIDAKLQNDKTVLETIKLEHTKDALTNEVKSVEITKRKLLKDSVNISLRLDSMSTVLLSMQNDKSLLQNNIRGLTSNKIELAEQLGFATINYNLQELKKYPGPNYTITHQLINVLQSSNKYRQRTFDSLLVYTKYDPIKYISLFVLYRGTQNTYYREKLFSSIPSTLKLLRGEAYLSNDFKNLLANVAWNNYEKGRLIDILLKEYNAEVSHRGKLDILNIISRFGLDPTFSFSTTSYNLYWDYLKINRDLFTSTDTLFGNEDRYLVLTHIMMHSPQLYFSLVVKYFGQLGSEEFVTSSANYAILKSLTTIDFLPNHKYNYLTEFGEANNLSPKKTDTKQYYMKYYENNKLKLDRWLYSNFDNFRRDTATGYKCIDNLTF